MRADATDNIASVPHKSANAIEKSTHRTEKQTLFDQCHQPGDE